MVLPVHCFATKCTIGSAVVHSLDSPISYMEGTYHVCR